MKDSHQDELMGLLKLLFFGGLLFLVAFPPLGLTLLGIWFAITWGIRRRDMRAHEEARARAEEKAFRKWCADVDRINRGFL